MRQLAAAVMPYNHAPPPPPGIHPKIDNFFTRRFGNNSNDFILVLTVS